jgi:hypothetical protein
LIKIERMYVAEGKKPRLGQVSIHLMKKKEYESRIGADSLGHARRLFNLLAVNPISLMGMGTIGLVDEAGPLI